MGLFGAIARVGSKLVRPVVRSPLVKGVVTQTALGAGLYAAGNALTGGGGSSLPALPSGGGFPALPGAGAPSIVGNRGIFQNDPNIVAALQPFAISKANLKTCFRSPIKGYVIRYDSKGDPYAIPKKLARAYLGWRPAKKPPISVGDWEAVKRADRTVKKVRKVMVTMTRVDKAVGKGGKIALKKKGK